MGDDVGLLGMKGISELLGVSNKQVYMWHYRRAKNGFPEPRAMTLVPQYAGDKRRTPLFDVMEVVDWYSTYDPLSRHGSHWAEKRARME